MRVLATLVVGLGALLGCSSDSADSIELGKVGDELKVCESAATGPDVVTESAIAACTSALFTISYDCETGTPVTVIEMDGRTIAIRAGQVPLQLQKNYTFDDLIAYCAEA